MAIQVLPHAWIASLRSLVTTLRRLGVGIANKNNSYQRKQNKR